MLHSFAGEHGTLGKEFVFNFPTPARENHAPTLMISTPSTNPVSVTVSVPGINFNTNSTVTRKEHAEIELPTSTYLSLTSSTQDKTVIVNADEEVSVYGMGGRAHFSGGFMAIPTHALGKKYMILTHASAYSFAPCYFSVSALEDKTDVQVTLPDQQPITITLNAYQTYQVHDGNNDLSRSVVEANKPIAVMAGVELAKVAKSTASNGLLEQLPSIDNFGENFVLAPFKGRKNGYIYRIATPEKVKIYISNIGLVDLDPGDMYEGDVTDDSITSITSDKPILVVQFMKGSTDSNGNSGMVIVPSTEMFVRDITFPVYDSPEFSDYTFYINIITQCSSKQGLHYDNTVLKNDFDTISHDGMCAFRSEVTSGTHNVNSTDPDVTFSVVVYGFRRHQGYAYTAGFNAISGEFVCHVVSLSYCAVKTSQNV